MGPLIIIIFNILFPLVAVLNTIRIRAFGRYVKDIISYRYADSFETYLEKTTLTFISINPDRKEIDIDISKSYKNLILYKVWDWDFEKMIVEE